MTTDAVGAARKPSAAFEIAVLEQGIFQISGEQIERLVVMTDLDSEEAVRHLHRRLERMGVIRRLRQLGAKDGDRVRIGSVELEFAD